jgi:glutamyl-tRNA synthetase
VHGPRHFAGRDLGDFVIRRADGSAAFLFSNVLDDALMQITHVLRGEDHLSNTPRQLLVLEALGLSAPRYGHVPLVHGEDGAPLSKRTGSASLRGLRVEGVLPEAICNHLARLGHALASGALMGMKELAAAFHVERLGRAPARHDPAQLAHWQREAVHAADAERRGRWMESPELGALVPAVRTRELREKRCSPISRCRAMRSPGPNGCTRRRRPTRTMRVRPSSAPARSSSPTRVR